jgi:hypothetical protein
MTAAAKEKTGFTFFEINARKTRRHDSNMKT